MLHASIRAKARTSAALAFFASALLVPAAALAQVGTLDQMSPSPVNNSASFNYDATSLTWQQQIKTGIAGQLEGLVVVISSGNVGSTFALRVRLGAAPSGQPVLFQANVVKMIAGNESQFVDMTAANINLAVNDLYVMEIQGNGQGTWGLGTYIAPPGQPLYSQPLFLNGAIHADGGWRLSFSSYMVNPCPIGKPCDDKNPCTTDDACGPGGICAGVPVTCFASDACHVAGTCDPQTGVCSDPEAANGTVCDDDDACTETDTCQAGVCTGASPVTCMPSDACHVAGTCDPDTGQCSNPAMANGTACDDGDACTHTDTCQAGVCTGASPVTCVPSDACNESIACNPESGLCEGTPKPDGTPCPNGKCMAGSCLGAGTTSSSSAGAGGSGGAGGSPSEGGAGGDKPNTQEGGCGCRTTESPASGAPFALLAGLALAAMRRRRAR